VDREFVEIAIPWLALVVSAIALGFAIWAAIHTRGYEQRDNELQARIVELEEQRDVRSGPARRAAIASAMLADIAAIELRLIDAFHSAHDEPLKGMPPLTRARRDDGRAEVVRLHFLTTPLGEHAHRRLGAAYITLLTPTLRPATDETLMGVPRLLSLHVRQRGGVP
jgi:hypothetical protein